MSLPAQLYLKLVCGRAPNIRIIRLSTATVMPMIGTTRDFKLSLSPSCTTRLTAKCKIAAHWQTGYESRSELLQRISELQLRLFRC